MTAENGKRALDRLRVWWRRQKLKRCYARIAEVELGKRYGLSPTMRMYQMLERDGWAELDDGELKWRDERVR